MSRPLGLTTSVLCRGFAADGGGGRGGAWRAVAAAGHPFTAGLSGVASRTPPALAAAEAASARALASPPSAAAGEKEAADTDDKEAADAGDKEAANDIAVLLCLAAAIRTAVTDAAARRAFTPDLLVSVEANATAATTLACNALGKLSPPVELESLMDAKNGGRNEGVADGLLDVPPLPPSALPAAALLRAYELRDEMEEALVQMNVFPPIATAVAGSSTTFGKPTPAARVAAGLAAMDDAEAAAAVGGGEGKGGTSRRRDGGGGRGGRGTADAETGAMAWRRAALESANSISSLLRGYDTALLHTCRVHKVTRGGTTFSIKVLVGVGNRAGAVGIGEGKADTAAAATERACRAAVRDLLPLSALTSTGSIPHPVRGMYVRTEVRVWPSRRGAGVSANNVFAALFALGGGDRRGRQGAPRAGGGQLVQSADAGPGGAAGARGGGPHPRAGRGCVGRAATLTESKGGQGAGGTGRAEGGGDLGGRLTLSSGALPVSIETTPAARVMSLVLGSHRVLSFSNAAGSSPPRSSAEVLRPQRGRRVPPGRDRTYGRECRGGHAQQTVVMVAR
ncbi:hypothetical protein MMPV_005504 [Pyropia vietnamensis]